MLNSMFGFQGFIFAQPVADIITTIIAIVLSTSLIMEIKGKTVKEWALES